MKVLKWVFLLAVAAAAFLTGGWLLRRGATAAGKGATAGTDVAANNRLFAAVLQTVRTYAVDSLDEASVYRLATSGMLTELGDPYAGVVADADTTDARGRIGPAPVQGIYLDLLDDLVTVVSVVSGSPASVAGIRPGDAVLRVDRTVIGTQRADQVAAMIDGAPGSEVKLRLGRERASAPLAVTLARGAVPALAEPLFELQNVTGYLKLSQVDDRAVAAAADGMAKVGAVSGGRGLILDLRGVAAGSLAAAVRLAELFLADGQAIVTTRGRNGKDSATIRSHKQAPGRDFPMVVLTNRGTGGPAEVVAGALQDHDRAVVVGEETFGRGVGYSFFPLGNGTSLRLTTAVWATPSGRVIQRLPVADRSQAATDSTPPRPKFTTDAGRTVLGGGGITPDREVPTGVEAEGSDRALALARDLLARATSRQSLMAVLQAK